MDEPGAEAGYVGEDTGTNKTGTRQEATGASGLDIDLLDGQNLTGEGSPSPTRDGMGLTAENLDLNDRQSLQDKAEVPPISSPTPHGLAEATSSKKEDSEEEDGNAKFSMMKDETDNIVMNMVVLSKRGSHDDVFILEKQNRNEIRKILFLQSGVPRIKEAKN